jgi:hypothetical protein
MHLKALFTCPRAASSTCPRVLKALFTQDENSVTLLAMSKAPVLHFSAQPHRLLVRAQVPASIKLSELHDQASFLPVTSPSAS